MRLWSGPSVVRDTLLRDRLGMTVTAVAALSLADMVRRGYVTRPALLLLMLAVLLLVKTLGPWTSVTERREIWWWVLPLLGLMWGLNGVIHHALWAGVLLAGLGTMLLWLKRPRHLIAVVGVTAATWTGVTLSPLLAGPATIDVVTMLRDGGLRLLHGLDPYTGVYPSTTPGAHTLPFTYSPMTALLSVPGALLGDPRWVSFGLAVVCMSCLVWLATTGSGPTSAQARAAAIALLLPLLPVMVWFGWTDTYALAPFLLWLVLRPGHRTVAILCLAAAVGAKYTILPALVPFFLWSPGIRRDVVSACFVAAVFIYGPFILWTGPARFWYDTVGFFIHLPPPPGSLSISGLLTSYGLRALPLWVPIVAGGFVVAMMWKWPARTMADSLRQGAALTAVIFLFSPWAFFNYWALVAVLLVGAAVTHWSQERLDELPALAMSTYYIRRRKRWTARLASEPSLPSSHSVHGTWPTFRKLRGFLGNGGHRSSRP